MVETRTFREEIDCLKPHQLLEVLPEDGFLLFEGEVVQAEYPLDGPIDGHVRGPEGASGRAARGRGRRRAGMVNQ